MFSTILSLKPSTLNFTSGSIFRVSALMLGLLLSLLTIAVIFFIDTRVATATTAPILYVAVIGFCHYALVRDRHSRLDRSKILIGLVVLCSVATLAAPYFSLRTAVPVEVTFANRILCVLALWIITGLLVRDMRAEQIISASLYEKDVLLKEIHHRVKNNLQIISSLFGIQYRRNHNEDVKAILKESDLRIQSIALIHEMLYSANDLSYINFDLYVRQLVDNIVRTFSADKIFEIEVVSNARMVDMDTAIPCGLIVNELVANSLQHAAATKLVGSTVHLTIKVEDRENALSISVADDGLGLRDDFDIKSAQTLGFKLINTLVRQLKGEIQVRSDGGTSVEILVPVS